MAEGRYKEWLDKDKLILLQGWKRKGLTDEEIAKKIGVRRETLYDWKKKFPNISNALKRGKEEVNYVVENALLKKALNGNTTAMIFWLKNNYPEKYRDHHKTKLEQELDDALKEKALIEARYFKAQAEELDKSSDVLANQMKELSVDELKKLANLGVSGNVDE